MKVLPAMAALLLLGGCAARRPARPSGAHIGSCQLQAVDAKGNPSEMSCRFGQTVTLWTPKPAQTSAKF